MFFLVDSLSVEALGCATRLTAPLRKSTEGQPWQKASADIVGVVRFLFGFEFGCCICFCFCSCFLFVVWYGFGLKKNVFGWLGLFCMICHGLFSISCCLWGVLFLFVGCACFSWMFVGWCFGSTAVTCSPPAPESPQTKPQRRHARHVFEGMRNVSENRIS